MTTHTYHEDVHTHGLTEGCPRCEEIVREPLIGADADLLLRLTIGEHLVTDADRRARQRLVELGVPVR